MTPLLRQRLSAAAHAALPHANPLSSQQFSELVSEVAKSTPSTAVDIGCGFGPFALGLAAVSNTSVMAYDINADNLERARLAGGHKLLRGSVEWVLAPFSFPQGTQFGAVICIGSSHALGSPIEAVARCASMVSPEGVVVFAELVWRSQPDPRFVEFLGVDPNFYWEREDAQGLLSSCGLKLERRIEASPESFQSYEDAVRLGRYKFAETLCQTDKDLVLKQADDWSSMYEAYGKHCLGFEAYVAHRVEA